MWNGGNQTLWVAIVIRGIVKWWNKDVQWRLSKSACVAYRIRIDLTFWFLFFFWFGFSLWYDLELVVSFVFVVVLFHEHFFSFLELREERWSIIDCPFVDCVKSTFQLMRSCWSWVREKRNQDFVDRHWCHVLFVFFFNDGKKGFYLMNNECIDENWAWAFQWSHFLSINIKPFKETQCRKSGIFSSLLYMYKLRYRIKNNL